MNRLDYLTLLKEARRLDASRCARTVRVAVLGDCSTQHLVAILPVLFARRGFRVDAFEAEYDSIRLEAFDGNSRLYSFAPDAIVLLNSTAKLRARYYAAGDDRTGFVSTIVSETIAVWEAIGRRTQTPIVQSTYALPLERFSGNFDNKVAGSLYACAQRINTEIVEQSRGRPNVLINDVDAIASYVGKRTWFDETQWVVSKSLCAIEHLPRVAQNIVDVVAATRGDGVKCVVVDLDNTLWGGTIGDDGLDGIRVGSLGDGEAFGAFQSYLRELRRRGVLLAVCSKNDHANALLPFREHQEMVLREGDLCMFVANWDNKVDNLRHIQAALNIGFESMVFLDDNPFERNLVRRFIPEMIVPELPEEPADYVSHLCSLNLFEAATASAADSARTDMYRDQERRASARLEFTSLEDYLRSLDMKACVERFTPFRLPRIAQLIQRSNQFNLTTRRYGEAECAAFMADAEGCLPLSVSLTDRFGDNGLILVAICRLLADAIDIDTFLMSCRVLQRGVEQLAMNRIVEEARRRGIGRILGTYVPTPKNGMVKAFYPSFGFIPLATHEDGTTQFALDVDAYAPAQVWISSNDGR